MSVSKKAWTSGSLTEKRQRSNVLYGADNFFQKMTNMESPRKNNDCYFYYYSTCTKGDSCTFRHEPSALGCETVCSFWKEGKCLNVHCNFRHMELRKNRKAIPCYWESQSSGCLKAHCPFLHQNRKELDSSGGSSDMKADISAKQNTMDKTKLTQASELNYGNTAVDPLVVNFEEESDNESAPTSSPSKSSTTHRSVTVKTLEEIRLERVQAESAAFYSYYSYPEKDVRTALEEADDLRRRIIDRMSVKPDDQTQIFSLGEIRKRKNRILGSDLNSDDDIKTPHVKRLRLVTNTKKSDLSDVKIKTLAEIRAEKLQSTKSCDTTDIIEKDDDEMMGTCEVSSTTKYETIDSPATADNKSSAGGSKLKLKRSQISNAVESSTEATNESSCKTKATDETSNNNMSQIDDVLLSDEEDMAYSNVSLKAEEEEELLKNLDDLLSE